MDGDHSISFHCHNPADFSGVAMMVRGVRTEGPRLRRQRRPLGEELGGEPSPANKRVMDGVANFPSDTGGTGYSKENLKIYTGSRSLPFLPSFSSSPLVVPSLPTLSHNEIVVVGIQRNTCRWAP